MTTAGCGANVLTYKIGTNTWTSKGFEPRVYVYNSNGVGKIGNTLYISGGESFCGGYGHIDGGFSAYNPATNTLTRESHPTPSSRPPESPGSSMANSTSFQASAPLYFYPEPVLLRERADPHGSIGTLPPSTTGACKRPAPHYHTNGAGGVINGSCGRRAASISEPGLLPAAIAGRYVER